MSEQTKKKSQLYAKPPKKISDRMRLVKSFGTKLEMSMARILRKEGIKYRCQPRLFGRPDFRISDSKIVAFCDSSFWHGRRRADLEGKTFKRNRDFWVKKLITNRARDLKTNRALRSMGWRVLRFWDTDILQSPEKVVAKLRAELKIR